MDALIALLFLAGVVLFVTLPLVAFTMRAFDRYPSARKLRQAEHRHEVVRVELPVREAA